MAYQDVSIPGSKAVTISGVATTTAFAQMAEVRDITGGTPGTLVGTMQASSTPNPPQVPTSLFSPSLDFTSGSSGSTLRVHLYHYVGGSWDGSEADELAAGPNQRQVIGENDEPNDPEDWDDSVICMAWT